LSLRSNHWAGISERLRRCTDTNPAIVSPTNITTDYEKSYDPASQHPQTWHSPLLGKL